jgi:hypothetical protein
LDEGAELGVEEEGALLLIAEKLRLHPGRGARL